MHVQATGRFADIPIALLVNALDMFPADPIGRHRVFRGRRQRAVAAQKRIRDLVRVGRLTMAPAGYRAWVDDVELQLTAREFEVLEVLARQPGEVLTRADLLRRVWGAGLEPGRRTVDVFFMRVLAKLGPAAGQLVTVNRVGYRLDA